PLRGTIRATVRSQVKRSETGNVLGRLPGTGPAAAEAVIIGGHYDHLGIGLPADGDSIYNGAVDNASGTAAVLELADAFVRSGIRPGRSLVFMAFGAEESGLLGSAAFAARPTIPLAQVAAVLNLDGLNVFGPTLDIAALGTDQSTLGDLFKAAASAEGLTVSENRDAAERGYFFRSDQFPFARAGVPGLFFQSGTALRGKPAEEWRELESAYTARRYHQPADEWIETYSTAGMVQQARVLARVALAVADAPAQPTWLPGSEFRTAGEARVK
ncbi:MAG: M20/M25/M40 family metallo-hydrolase, partial [Gemmatimonadales bacterium]